MKQILKSIQTEYNAQNRVLQSLETRETELHALITKNPEDFFRNKDNIRTEYTEICQKIGDLNFKLFTLNKCYKDIAELCGEPTDINIEIV